MKFAPKRFAPKWTNNKMATPKRATTKQVAPKRRAFDRFMSFTGDTGRSRIKGYQNTTT